MWKLDFRSRGLLINVGIKLAFESDLLVMTRRDKYRNRYLRGELFILPIIYDTSPDVSAFIRTNNSNNNACTSTYIFIHINLWHGRL